jgi:hypothetical protein
MATPSIVTRHRSSTAFAGAGIAADGNIDAELLAPPARRSDSYASSTWRPENVGVPKSRMCGPQVRFCERGPCESGGPDSSAPGMARSA